MKTEKTDELGEHILKVKDFFIEFTKKVISLDGAKLSFELNLSELKALTAFTDDKKKCTMSELARNAGVTMPSMTEVIDSLVKENIVERQRDENDRRVVLVELTEKGKRMRKEFMDRRRLELINIFNRLDRNERKEFVESLEKVRSILQKLNI
ncbi:MAG: MarR family transcriptional regulator [Candidatus Schekmanbacteria bacterium]|nr:MarR family transcriptional regulator [Candidatus Schekmanbacteria bacterium]